MTPCYDLKWMIGLARSPLLRPMRQFAEEEIVIPEGPFAGRKFSCARQPYTRLWFDAVDSGNWSRFVATGPTQSGKTLSCFVVPTLYHLFEVGETVICAVPDMDMAIDKWREDLLPVIERSRYRQFLPKLGSGSRGGRVEAIRFRNGATLKFMSGGGGDKSRAGFTSRVVVITETDGLDEQSQTSREADKITQIEARTRAYGRRKRIYMECTVSTEEGRTWREYQSGTRSKIVLPCPHCFVYVTPERENLVGWKEAESQQLAMQAGAFVCPSCKKPWSDEDRAQANHRSILIHEGQCVGADATVKGEMPATDTLGFRWSAVHNLFLTPGEFAADEWRAFRSPNEDNAEKEMRQFVWCIPVTPSKWDQTLLDTMSIASRTAQVAKGIVPTGTRVLTAAIDLGKFLAHWVVVAWQENAACHVVDYGRIEVASDHLGVEQAIMVALREFREMVEAGWPREENETRMLVDRCFSDAGYMTDVIYSFCRESGGRYLPSIGRGALQQHAQWYNRPTRTGSTVKHVGEGFHINLIEATGVFLVEVDSDHWKTWVHQRLTTPSGTRGALSFYRALPEEHLALAHHLTAEAAVEEFIAGKGTVTRWERRRKQNHWLDALYNACAAGHLCGVRLVSEAIRPEPKQKRLIPAVTRDDGRPWIDTERWRDISQRFFR